MDFCAHIKIVEALITKRRKDFIFLDFQRIEIFNYYKSIENLYVGIIILIYVFI
jgi:hypothetical protein